MDNVRLANVIYGFGEKLQQSHYKVIVECIDQEKFSLDPIVIAYKAKDSILNKIAFVLNDKSQVMISEETMKKLSTLNIDRKELEVYMNSDYNSFKQIIEAVNGNF